MESVHKCIVSGCTGNLTEGVRGFFKCDACGAKIKKSLVVQPDPVVVETKAAVVKDKTSKAATPKVMKQAPIGDTDVPKVRQPAAVITTNDGKVLHGKTTTINCIDCGAERIIKVQDAFQVKRCVTCQKNFTKARRNDRLKEKRNAAKAE